MQILDNDDITGTPGQQWESNFLNIGMEKKINENEMTDV